MYAPLQKQSKATAKTSSQSLARTNRQAVYQPEHLTADLQNPRENQAPTKTAHASPRGEASPTGGGSYFSYNFADIPVFHRPVRGLQAKLTVNVPGDAYEQEADRVAEQVMRMPDPQAAPTLQVSDHAAGVQRECACGGSCDDCKKKNHNEDHAKVQMKAAGPVNAGGVEAPPIVHDVLRSPGQPLDASTRAYMEPRFGHDFSKVRVHTDAKAAESARTVGARAYTVGSNVVFGAGGYGPGTQEGQRLLGHELTHVVQQAESPKTNVLITAELETACGPTNPPAGAIIAAAVQRVPAPMLARFTDTGHHVVEEAALAGAGFSEQQMKSVERGNIQRDYSQVGRIGNIALLCQPRDFGGYRPEEHFDNYMWDAVTQGWRTRGGSAFEEQGVDVGKTPIDFISAQLDGVASHGLTDAGLVHLGNAFHTIEDFFAHSNFVELMQGDTSRETTLITGNPVGPSQSVDRIFEAITPLGVRERYREESEAKIKAADPGTHTAMAHDDPTTPNYTVARRLAALVIQDLGAEILAVMTSPEPARQQLMKERVLAKVVRYVRPPDPKDRWWDTLIAADRGKIDARLDEAARKTPITVNQCALSPLKNIEASQDSPMALPIGVAIPTVINGNQAWFQVGAGVVRQLPFEPDTSGPQHDARGASPVVGVQFTGKF